MRVKVIGLALAGTLGVAPPVLAGNPGGNQYTIDLSGAHSIWDPGDDLTNVCESDTVGGISVDVCLDFPFAVSPKGRIEGNGSFDFSASGSGVSISGNASGALKGNIKSQQSLTQVKFTLKVAGSVTASGIGACKFNGNGTVKSEIDATGDLLGTMDVKACVKCPGIGGGCEKINGIPIATNVGSGDWSLSLDVITDAKNKLSGTATASTAVGDFDFDLKGSYKDKTDDSKLSGKSDAASRGASLQVKALEVTGAVIDAAVVKYNIAGAKGEHIQ